MTHTGNPLSEGEREMLQMLVEMDGSLSAITFRAAFDELEAVHAIRRGYIKKVGGQYAITSAGRAALSPSHRDT